MCDESSFLRFYGRSTQEIEECVKEMRAVLPQQFKVHDYTPAGGVNGVALPCRLIWFLFASAHDREMAYANPESRAIYTRWSTPVAGSSFAARRPGNPMGTHGVSAPTMDLARRAGVSVVVARPGAAAGAMCRHSVLAINKRL